jgi:hypothetical protein
VRRYTPDIGILRYEPGIISLSWPIVAMVPASSSSLLSDSRIENIKKWILSNSWWAMTEELMNGILFFHVMASNWERAQVESRCEMCNTYDLRGLWKCECEALNISTNEACWKCSEKRPSSIEKE